MDQFTHDVRYALRMLRKQPAITLTMVATLALGIGANTAVFSVINAVLLRALPYDHPDELVMIHEKRPAEGVMNNSVSPADFLDWEQLNQSFIAIAALSPEPVDLTGAGDPVQLTSGAVSARFFDVLQVPALHGRLFAPHEDAPGSQPVVVLGYPLWQQHFGADPSIVGRPITLNDVPHEVIGVLPADFEPLDPAVQLWVPLVLRGGSTPPPRASHFLDVFGRLKPGVSLEAARAEMDAIGWNLEAQHRNESRGHSAHVVSLREEIVMPVRRGLLVIAAAVSLVLLIACTNVANLLLARAAGRRRELAVRAALGAARSRLLGQALTEGVVLAFISGVVGLLVASYGVELLVAQMPENLRRAGLDRVTLDGTVLGFTFVLCVATGIVAAVLPAWLAARHDPGEPLRDGGRSPAGIRKGVRFGLVVAEVSLASVLLVAAGLMLRSFERVLSQAPGISFENRLNVMLTLPSSRYGDPDALRRARTEIESRMRSVPGVIAVGTINLMPFTALDGRRGISIEGLERAEGDAPFRAHPRLVSADYFSAIGIRLASGRAFAETDNETGPPVAIVNQAMVRRFWPNASPLGKRVRLNGGDEPWREVVGVIDDVRHWGLDGVVNPEMYIPFDQMPSTLLNVVLHAAVPPVPLVPELTRVVREFDPNLPFTSARTLDEVAARSLAPRRWSATLLGTFGALALILAAVGIFGVMAQLVSSRRSEIGIRLTLGAGPGSVFRQVVGEGITYAAVGLLVGLSVSFMVMRGLEALLFEVKPTDPVTLGAVGLVLLAIAAAASLGPARRAMRIDPAEAMRVE
jgi:predicted permease